MSNPRDLFDQAKAKVEEVRSRYNAIAEEFDSVKDELRKAEAEYLEAGFRYVNHKLSGGQQESPPATD